MAHIKRSFVLLMLLTVIIGSRTFAQDFFSFNSTLKSARAKEVIQDNEYTPTGYEQGNFYYNPILLNGSPLDYNIFNIGSKGELSVIKGSAITGKPTQVPFYVYLRRGGKRVDMPGKDRPDINQTRIDISEILRYAKPGDQLVIEAVRKEDGPVKRILKLLEGGC